MGMDQKQILRSLAIPDNGNCCSKNMQKDKGTLVSIVPHFLAKNTWEHAFEMKKSMWRDLTAIILLLLSRYSYWQCWMHGGNPPITYSWHKRSVYIYITGVTYAEVFQEVCHICRSFSELPYICKFSQKNVTYSVTHSKQDLLLPWYKDSAGLSCLLDSEAGLFLLLKQIAEQE